MAGMAPQRGENPGGAPRQTNSRLICRRTLAGQRGIVAPGIKRNKEYSNDGRSDAGAGLRLLRAGDRLHLRLRTALTGASAMIFDYSLAGAVSLGLLIYLTYALLRPERF